MDFLTPFKSIFLQSDVAVDEVDQAAYEELGKSAPDNLEDGFLGIPFINDDFYELVFRFGFSMLILLIIVRFIYYPTTKRKDYLFTFLLISVITFFICYTLQSNKIKLGLALGLFAVFGIIRYRTDAIAIKEMTYLFIVIGLSVINALSNNKVTLAELGFLNASVILIVYSLEKVFLLKHESTKLVIYEKIELIKPSRRKELIEDLENRTGLKIHRVSVGKIDFLKDTAQVFIHYFETDNAQYHTGNTVVDDDD